MPYSYSVRPPVVEMERIARLAHQALGWELVEL